MERVESCHSTWLFDTDRMRFRRVPRGLPVDGLALERDWEPYFGLELAAESGAFAVVLNESGTRFLRSWRHTEPCGHCSPAPPADVDITDVDITGDVTAEIALAPSE